MERTIDMATVVACLVGGWDFQHCGHILTSVVVRPKFGFRHTGEQDGFWILTDNGGELNVERANCPETLVSIPATSLRSAIDPATMAYRVSCVIAGRAIDWLYRMDAEDVDMLVPLAAHKGFTRDKVAA